MKTLRLICVLGTLGAATVVVALRASSAQAQDDAQQPWVVGRCYRVFPAERDQTYVFKVLSPPAGQWLRVQSDPSAPRVPGARPSVPLWLNLQSPFAVQEWPCTE